MGTIPRPRTSGKLKFKYTGEYEQLDKNTYRLLTSGTFTVKNKGKAAVSVVGGGAGGAVGYLNYNSNHNLIFSVGGASGYIANVAERQFSKSETIEVTIGAGGEALYKKQNVSTSSSTRTVTTNPGGDTSFGDITAAGGGAATVYEDGSSSGAVDKVTGGSGGAPGGVAAKGKQYPLYPAQNGVVGGTQSGVAYVYGYDDGGPFYKTAGKGQTDFALPFGDEAFAGYCCGGATGALCYFSTIGTNAAGTNGDGKSNSAYTDNGTFYPATAPDENTGNGGNGGVVSVGSGTTKVNYGAASKGADGCVLIRIK